MLEAIAERSLIDAAVGGDDTAVERLLLEHFSKLERYIAPNIPAEARRHFAVEDVLQDVFAQAYRDIASFDSESGCSFVAWLKGIADHRLADGLKRFRRKKRGGDMHRLTPKANAGDSVFGNLIDLVYQDSNFPSRVAAGNEASKAIQVALATLSIDQREVICARYLEQQSVDEIAKQTGRTQGAVRGLIHRAKEKLRAAMGRSSRWLSSR